VAPRLNAGFKPLCATGGGLGANPNCPSLPVFRSLALRSAIGDAGDAHSSTLCVCASAPPSCLLNFHPKRCANRQRGKYFATVHMFGYQDFSAATSQIQVFFCCSVVSVGICGSFRNTSARSGWFLGTEYCNNEYSCRLLGLPARLPGGRGDETFFFVVNVFFRPRSPPQRGACGMYAALRPVYRYIGTIIVTDPSFFSARCRRASRENWLSCSLALRSQVYEASVSCGGSDQAQQTTQRAFYQSPGNVFAIWMLRCHAVP
jgi:hypothetical protein